MKKPTTPYEKKVTELYQALGRFVVTFEECCDAIRRCIILHPVSNNLNFQDFTRPLLNHLTAEPLRSSWISICENSGLLNGDSRLLLRVLSRQFQDLTVYRNDLLHSHMIIGSNIFKHEPTISRLKAKNTKDGEKWLPVDISARELFGKSDEARSLADVINVWHYYAILPFPKKKPIEDMLEIRDKVVVRKKMVSSRSDQFELLHSQLTGLKGSTDEPLRIAARNTNDYWYIVTDNSDAAAWGQTNLSSIVDMFPELRNELGDLQLGEVAIRLPQSCKWRRLDYDWMPEEGEPIPDFDQM